MAVSTILDPRFKNLHFKNGEACASAMSLLRRTISESSTSQNISSESDTDSVTGEYDFWKEHKELAHKKGRKAKGGLHDELSLYIKNPVTPLKSNPLETWEDLKEIFPGLYRQPSACYDCSLIRTSRTVIFQRWSYSYTGEELSLIHISL